MGRGSSTTTGTAISEAGGGAIVRPARASDLEDLLRLYSELADSPAQATAIDDPAAPRALVAVLADPARHLVVAVAEERVVGTADLLIAQNLTHGARPWGIIENVVVSRAGRRRGVGRALFEHLLDLARGADCYKLQLLSGKQRVEAHRFYRAIGFESVAEGFKLYLDERH
jgi:GNAT superfamily N-acetyltransferase